MKRCDACGAEMVFALTGTVGPGAKERTMPLDPEPARGGNVLLVDSERGPAAIVLAGAQLEQARHRRIHLHTAHHFTCPEGERFQRARPPRPSVGEDLPGQISIEDEVA